MKWFCVALSFFLVAFGQPATIPYLGVFSAVCGFALFWWAMIQFSGRFWLSVFWFASVQAVQLFWMASPHYMGWMILVVYGGLVFCLGVQFGLLAFFFREAKSFTISKGLAVAGAWVLLEWSRLFVLSGFPFNPVGLSLTDSIAVQWAALGGVFGLSFWVIWVNVLCFNAFLLRRLKPTLLFISMALLPYFFGGIHPLLISKWMTPPKEIKVALLQTALLPEQRSYTSVDPKSYIHPLDQWQRVWDLLPANLSFDLIVLPEAAFPYGASRPLLSYERVKKAWIEQYGVKAIADFPPLEAPYAYLTEGNGRMFAKVSHLFIAQSLSNHLKADLILGLDDEDAHGKYNAAFHIQPRKKICRYEKRILVPVSEYLPLENIDFLSAFYAKEYNIFDSLSAGKEAKIFSSFVPIGPSVCYEEIFGYAMRQMRLRGAQLFVNVTNDVWYPGTQLPWQHFHHARIRAVENGVYLLRACNTGVTGGVDCFGRMLSCLPVSDHRAGLLGLTLSISSYPTLYTICGDLLFVFLSLFFLLRNRLMR